MKLAVPAGAATRPTRERVRQAALNMLQQILPDAQVLDVFAGAGAMGLEAVSRGARGAVFVENHPAALRCLRDNVEHARTRSAGAGKGAASFNLRIMAVDAMQGDFGGGEFDLIWADPPYELALAWVKACGAKLCRSLASHGNFVMEIDGQDKASVLEWIVRNLPAICVVKTKTFGRTELLWFERVSHNE